MKLRNGNENTNECGTVCTATDTIPTKSAYDPTIAVVSRVAMCIDMQALPSMGSIRDLKLPASL